MMYNLSACAIARNEGRYIQEWIEFHLLQGFEHFYIYNNQSVDDTVAKLDPYVRAGVVTLIDWPVNPPQFKAYNDCLHNYGKQTSWMGFFDIDEFMYSPTVAGVQKAIQQALKRTQQRVGGIAAHWLLFGANGHEKYTDQLVIERFNKRQKNVNHHVKSIVRPDVTIGVGHNPHYFVFKPGYIAIDENGKRLADMYGITEKGSAGIFRVAHFHVKSKEEFFKRKRESPDPGHGRGYTDEKIAEMFQVHNVNEVIDLSLQRYANIIRRNLEARKLL